VAVDQRAGRPGANSGPTLPPALPRLTGSVWGEVREVGMARAAAALSVVAFLVLGSGVVGDEPTVLLALLGTALCALGCVAAARVTAGVAPAVALPGRRARRATAGASRQHHPDAAGRPRPRAPSLTLRTT
jgi:hypothetical protein